MLHHLQRKMEREIHDIDCMLAVMVVIAVGLTLALLWALVHLYGSGCDHQKEHVKQQSAQSSTLSSSSTTTNTSTDNQSFKSQHNLPGRSSNEPFEKVPTSGWDAPTTCPWNEPNPTTDQNSAEPTSSPCSKLWTQWAQRSKRRRGNQKKPRSKLLTPEGIIPFQPPPPPPSSSLLLLSPMINQSMTRPHDFVPESIPTTDPVPAKESALPRFEHLSTAGMPMDQGRCQGTGSSEGWTTTGAADATGRDGAVATKTEDESFAAVIISPPTTPGHNSCSFLQDYW